MRCQPPVIAMSRHLCHMSSGTLLTLVLGAATSPKRTMLAPPGGSRRLSRANSTMDGGNNGEIHNKSPSRPQGDERTVALDSGVTTCVQSRRRSSTP